MTFTDQIRAGRMEDVRLVEEASLGIDTIGQLRRKVRILERDILVAAKEGKLEEDAREELEIAKENLTRAEEEFTVLTSEIGRRVLMGNVELANIANAELERELEEMNQA